MYFIMAGGRAQQKLLRIPAVPVFAGAFWVVHVISSYPENKCGREGKY
jgi:hypothetical protein